MHLSRGEITFVAAKFKAAPVVLYIFNEHSIEEKIPKY
jgi:hypothetical protein